MPGIVILIIVFIIIANALNSMSNKANNNEQNKNWFEEIQDIFTESDSNDGKEFMHINLDDVSPSGQKQYNSPIGQSPDNYTAWREASDSEPFTYEMTSTDSEPFTYEMTSTDSEPYTYEMTGEDISSSETFSYKMSGNEMVDNMEFDYSKNDIASTDPIYESSIYKGEIGTGFTLTRGNVLRGIIFSEILQPPKARKFNS